MPPLSRQTISRELLARGRPGDPRLGEWVKLIESPDEISDATEAVVLVGSPDDLGVTLNRGRAGAEEGPDSIRASLYKMTLPMDLNWEKRIQLYDFGNVVVSGDILETHRRSQAVVSALSARGATVIALGGGHDFAAPHFLGMTEGKKSTAKKKSSFALINIDPHLDVRPWEDGRPNSGTAFRQILDSSVLKGNAFAEFGIRSNRNAREHFDYCRSQKVTVTTLDAIRAKPASVGKQFEALLKKLSQKATAVGVTFDMDSCRDAEGSSAAPVVGFSAWELIEMAKAAGKQSKVSILEIAEVAPPLDPTLRSSRIAAEMLYAFLYTRGS